MKIFEIKSNLNGKKLAEVRTDGTTAQVLYDSTGGKISSMFSSGFDQGKEEIAESGVVSLSPYSGQSIRVYRYLLENGDLVLITSDGLTVSLNGSILDENYKQRLLEALSSGVLKVKSKSDAVDPSTFFQPRPVDMIEQERQKIVKQKIEHHLSLVGPDKTPKFTKNNDPRLRFLYSKEKHDRKFKTNLAFLLVHGDGNG